MLKEPLLDKDAPWKKRFSAPVVLYTQLARGAPTRGMAVGNQTGTMQLYAWDVATGNLRQLTTRSEGVLFGEISQDGHHIYYMGDQKGDEKGHVVRIPFEGGPLEDITPDLPPYTLTGFHFYFTTNAAGNLIGLVLPDSEGFHFHLIELGGEGEIKARRTLYNSQKMLNFPRLSADGKIAVVGTAERCNRDYTSLMAFDGESGKVIGELWDGAENDMMPIAFSPVQGDDRLLARTDRTGFKRPLIWNPRTGEREDLALGDLEGELPTGEWSLDGERILLNHYQKAVQQFYTFHLKTKTLKKLNHPSGHFLRYYFIPNGNIYSQCKDATHPTRLVELDGETGELKRTVLAAGEVPEGHPWKSITYTSSDGQEIQAWLGLPDGKGPFPTILETHGGPAAVMPNTFYPESQAWLDHGFAYLVINQRGSATFGKAFQEKIMGDFGHWEVEDMVAARDWLVQNGIAKPDQILLTGQSYGGYLTLQALGTKPELWAGGMGIGGVSDWVVMYEDGTDETKSTAKVWFGGSPKEKPETYARMSPVTYVDKVRAPVLILHGRNDARCPERQIVEYEAKLKALGKPVEIDWGEVGHGAFSAEEQIRGQEVMLKFAYRVLNKQIK
jgi:dipeptidyl aminopeptidase/acylaminoacyl peptidase